MCGEERCVMADPQMGEVRDVTEEFRAAVKQLTELRLAAAEVLAALELGEEVSVENREHLRGLLK